MCYTFVGEGYLLGQQDNSICTSETATGKQRKCRFPVPMFKCVGIQVSVFPYRKWSHSVLLVRANNHIPDNNENVHDLS